MFRYFIVIWLSFILVPSYAQNKSFVLCSPQVNAQIIYDPRGPVLDSISAYLLANDIEVVSGFKPRVSSDLSSAKGNVIIIGNSRSELVKKVLGSNKPQDLDGKWECYGLRVLEKPISNIEKALVISGSDKRGTAFGVFDVSEKIGVSPWYWWADVYPEKKKELVIDQVDFVSKTPSIKYRGIFLNDEDWGLQPWAAKTFEPEVGDIGPKTYSKIFELLLRLKANLIWPAMHDCTKAFFSYPANVRAAEDYGIVVGTSHAEPMLRNNVGEWNEKTMGHFNYLTNKSTIYNYWQQRVKESKNMDAIYSMGMRGVHDSAMEGVKSKAEAVNVLETIISDQRDMLQKEISSKLPSVPQAFTAYKEVLEVYDHGLHLPEDITIVWPDDNYGYIQRLSNSHEQQREAGSGVYYHASYWGRPHDYLWLSSTHPKLIWEEMHKAYSQNAKTIWVLNVGDIKPLEYSTDLFLSMAYNMDAFKDPQSVDLHTTLWLSNKLGHPLSVQAQNILNEYYQLAFERRPEFMGWSQTEPTTQTRLTDYNHFFYGDEAQKRIDRYDILEKKVKELKNTVMPGKSDAFFELVYYPVVSASLINKKFLYQDKSYWYGKQKRLSANDYVLLAKQAYNEIVKETEYYNNIIAGGKWKHMMSMAPRKLPVFSEPINRALERDPKEAFSLLPEGFIRLDSSLWGLGKNEFFLPAFTPSGPSTYFIDLYLKEEKSVSWSASVNKSWIKLSKSQGRLLPEFGKNQVRLWISVDWGKVSGREKWEGRIAFKGNGKNIEVKVNGFSGVQNELTGYNGFVETNGYISMWASHYSQKTSKMNGWKDFEGLGYTGKCVYSPYVDPVAIDTSQIINKAPSLSYDFYSFTETIPTVNIYSLPTHPVNNAYRLRYGVSIDDHPVQIVDFKTFGRSQEWKQNVLKNNAVKQLKTHHLKKGKHTLKIYMIDPGVILDRIEIDLGGLKNAYSAIEESKNVSN